jgi:hypothetical protein
MFFVCWQPASEQALRGLAPMCDELVGQLLLYAHSSQQPAHTLGLYTCGTARIVCARPDSPFLA